MLDDPDDIDTEPPFPSRLLPAIAAIDPEPRFVFPVLKESEPDMPSREEPDSIATFPEFTFAALVSAEKSETEPLLPSPAPPEVRVREPPAAPEEEPAFMYALPPLAR